MPHSMTLLEPQPTFKTRKHSDFSKPIHSSSDSKQISQTNKSEQTTNLIHHIRSKVKSLNTNLRLPNIIEESPIQRELEELVEIKSSLKIGKMKSQELKESKNKFRGVYDVIMTELSDFPEGLLSLRKKTDESKEGMGDQGPRQNIFDECNESFRMQHNSKTVCALRCRQLDQVFNFSTGNDTLFRFYYLYAICVFLRIRWALESYRPNNLSVFIHLRI